MDLKRYDKAVIVLADGTVEQRNRAVALIKQHSLFNVGLKRFSGDAGIVKEIKVRMGESLASNKEFP